MPRPAVILVLSTRRLMAPSLGSMAVPVQITMLRPAALQTVSARAIVAPQLVLVGCLWDGDSEPSGCAESKDVEKATWPMPVGLARGLMR